MLQGDMCKFSNKGGEIFRLFSLVKFLPLQMEPSEKKNNSMTKKLVFMVFKSYIEMIYQIALK